MLITSIARMVEVYVAAQALNGPRLITYLFAVVEDLEGVPRVMTLFYAFVKWSELQLTLNQFSNCEKGYDDSRQVDLMKKSEGFQTRNKNSKSGNILTAKQCYLG